ncbi:MAG TPA: hypothetical protein ENJ09_15755, partial [Planctomycetes bacterium]|nr:hypothetical protein [Planctomycetota bacterium]
MFFASLALTGLSALSAGPQVATPAPTPVLQDLVTRLSDTGNRVGFATATFDDTTFEVLRDAHQLQRVMTIGDFPLPGGTSVDLTLRPVDVWEAGGKARVILEDGSVEYLAPSIQLFSTHVQGLESTGFLGVSREMMHGYLSIGGDTFILSTGADDGTRKPLAISHSDVFGRQGNEFCNVMTDAPSGVSVQPQQSRAGLEIWETKVFIECDNKFRGRFSSNQATIDYATLLVGASSEIYRRDLGATMIIPNGNVQVWNSTPPWGKITTFGDISAVRSWWNSSSNPNKSVARAQVHVLSYPVFGGVAWGIGILCQKTNSYAISSCYGSFPYPIKHTSGSNWDLYVFSHESGHLYGSQHTFDYVPPINCNDGSGPDKGTIMSYCHQTYGVGGVGMRFHKRVQDNMRGTIPGAACVKKIPIRLGDYNGDDIIDQIDTDAFD